MVPIFKDFGGRWEGLQLKNITLLVFFLWLVKSLKKKIGYEI